MLYQAPSPQRKKEPPARENKIRLFLKRSSEPLLNLQNAAQQVRSTIGRCAIARIDRRGKYKPDAMMIITITTRRAFMRAETGESLSNCARILVLPRHLFYRISRYLRKLLRAYVRDDRHSILSLSIVFSFSRENDDIVHIIHV